MELFHNFKIMLGHLLAGTIIIENASLHPHCKFSLISLKENFAEIFHTSQVKK